MSINHSNKLLVFLTSVCVSAICAGASQTATAQIDFTKSDEELDLAKDSPFRDPDVIYLEADELDNDQENGVLTASGQVEGRYQDKTLRADKVVYYTDTGQVIATGSVTLVNAAVPASNSSDN